MKAYSRVQCVGFRVVSHVMPMGVQGLGGGPWL